MAKAGTSVLSDGLVSFIKEWKNKPGNLIMILHHVQEEQGYISKDAAFEVSKLTDIPLARIYGVVTFYHFFKTQKPGKNQISVCLGTACYLKGGQDIFDEVHDQLHLGPKDISTEDGMFSLEPVRCIGCCGLSPVMSINGDVYGKLTKSQIPGILNKYRQ